MKKIVVISILISIFASFSFTYAGVNKSPMTFKDIVEIRSVGSYDVSQDGKMFIYTLSTPDIEKNKRFSDIFVTPLAAGKTRQMTFTKDKNESSPKWYKDGEFFAFLSDRFENKRQVFFMRPDGGEAWKITDEKEGVGGYSWSRDWTHLAYTAGKSEERQLYLMPPKGGTPEQLTNHKTPVQSFIWNPDGSKIYFTAPDSVDTVDKERKDGKFDVIIKDQVSFPLHLWEIDIKTKEEKRLTGGSSFSVSSFIISDDGTKIGFIGNSAERYSSLLEREVYLFNLKSYSLSRITDNAVSETNLSFSPDSKLFAFVVNDGEKSFMNLRKMYVMPSEGGKIT